jgi:hypothetical protein
VPQGDVGPWISLPDPPGADSARLFWLSTLQQREQGQPLSLTGAAWVPGEEGSYVIEGTPLGLLSLYPLSFIHSQQLT